MHERIERDRLICEHADVARRIALKMAKRIPDWVPREDLVGAGMIGLVEAADRFDHTRDESFLTFAEHRIRGAVLDELRRGDMVPRRVRQLARKIAAAIRKLEQTGGGAPDETLIARELGITVECYREGLTRTTFELAPLDDDEPTIASTTYRAPDDEAAHLQMLAHVRTALEELDARDVRILALHFLEEMTFQEIASVLAITPSRVCQLMWRAVARLRVSLGATPTGEAAAS
jgi:RNA polymerase sigma factor for flagellar operon FliA